MRQALVLFLGFLLLGLPSGAAATELTVERLKNGTYFIPAWEDQSRGEWVQLKDGKYNRKDPDNFLLVEIVDVAMGPLRPGGEQAGAVIYGYNTGGTGFFVMLCAVVDDQGKLRNSEVVDLEDRVRINSLSIKSGKIVVDMLVHGPTDPAPFPTVRKIAAYSLAGNKLVDR